LFPIFVPAVSDFSSRVSFQRVVIFPMIFPPPVLNFHAALLLVACLLDFFIGFSFAVTLYRVRFGQHAGPFSCRSMQQLLALVFAAA
jgi:hypothetical protein